MRFPFFKQLDAMDCGPACLRMICKYYGKSITLEFLREKTRISKSGVSLLGLADAAEEIGFRTVGTRLTFEQLISQSILPAIIHWDQNHYVVLVPGSTKNKLIIADPAVGLLVLKKQDFLFHWNSERDNGNKIGIALFLEPTPEFNNFSLTPYDEIVNEKINWYKIIKLLSDQKKYIFQLTIGFILAIILQIVFPFLTQSIVDRGINNQDINFIQLILFAQLILLFSQTFIEFIRSKLLLYISTRLSIKLLSKFWSKLLRLPISFFDSKHPGDIMQRLQDQNRIEFFLTGSFINTLLSIISIIVLSAVLLHFNFNIFLIYFSGSFLYFLWIRIFLRYRRELDHKRFGLSSKENNATMQLINGMQEIKLNNAENTFRWEWESIKAGIYNLSFKNLSVDQYQRIGAVFINQSKNIIITYLTAKLVIEGYLTLGMMLAIQYIIGQLNGPLEQIISFSKTAQDAKLSLERINDIHSVKDETSFQNSISFNVPDKFIIKFTNVYFSYTGDSYSNVLNKINLEIESGKITAIVGMSGSGKTTLLKLMLHFYDSYEGDIYINDVNFKKINKKDWRMICGAVMQDSYIFNSTIKKNITVQDDNIDSERLIAACETANILSFINSLPLGFYSKIGTEGAGLSGGQKQRIAIARAVYKNPRIIFLDEATNSLDSNNEQIIHNKLHEFYKGRTVVVVAHRLSTVINADKIVVLDKGSIVEEGTHEYLISLKGNYYELIKNQLNLESHPI